MGQGRDLLAPPNAGPQTAASPLKTGPQPTHPHSQRLMSGGTVITAGDRVMVPELGAPPCPLRPRPQQVRLTWESSCSSHLCGRGWGHCLPQVGDGPPKLQCSLGERRRPPARPKAS